MPSHATGKQVMRLQRPFDGPAVFTLRSRAELVEQRFIRRVVLHRFPISSRSSEVPVTVLPG